MFENQNRTLPGRLAPWVMPNGLGTRPQKEGNRAGNWDQSDQGVCAFAGFTLSLTPARWPEQLRLAGATRTSTATHGGGQHTALLAFVLPREIRGLAGFVPILSTHPRVWKMRWPAAPCPHVHFFILVTRDLHFCGACGLMQHVQERMALKLKCANDIHSYKEVGQCKPWAHVHLHLATSVHSILVFFCIVLVLLATFGTPVDQVKYKTWGELQRLPHFAGCRAPSKWLLSFWLSPASTQTACPRF